MAKKVNINISLPIGSVQIYVDPRKQMQAEKLITRKIGRASCRERVFATV